jgi:hypothetical protein
MPFAQDPDCGLKIDAVCEPIAHCLQAATPNSLARHRDEHERHNKKVASIQYNSDRLRWANSVCVRSLNVR